MTNEPRNKVWPHLAQRKKRFGEAHDPPPDRLRGRLRRGLAAAVLLVALLSVAPLLQREREGARPQVGGIARVTACDRLAAHPSDTQKLAPGVAQDQVDTARGKAACLAALKLRPDDGRTLYQLGRMFFYDKEYATGIGYMRRSAAADYPQGEFVLGLILVQGNGTDPDLCEGGRLWVRAARARHLYSKIYLASNWRDGMFKSCGLDVTEAEIGQMLTAAEDLVETPQEKDDLAQAKENWTKP